MGLVERLAVEPPAVVPKCAVGRLLESLSEVEAVALQDAIDRIRLADPNQRRSRQHCWTSKWLCGELNAEGYDIHRATMNRHVNKECSCGS